MKLVLGWVALAVTALFVLLNLEAVRIWFFGARIELPLAFVMLGAALLGAVATYAFTSLKRKP